MRKGKRYDHYWPTDLYCQMITERLAQERFPHRYTHLHYPGVGHMIRYPYLPTTRVTMNGGSAKQNAYAAAHSWQHVLQFWQETFA
jgi:hypothetical protein